MRKRKGRRKRDREMGMIQEELLTMPEELVIISDAGGLASPSQVAEAHVKDIMDGEYSTTIGIPPPFHPLDSK